MTSPGTWVGADGGLVRLRKSSVTEPETKYSKKSTVKWGGGNKEPEGESWELDYS